MDINRVELKGRVSNDVTYRKNAKGGEWATFSIATNEISAQSQVDREKSVVTYTNVAVFSSAIVERIKEVGIHQGCHVWIVGKLFTKQVNKGGYTHPYTSVVVQDISILKTKKEKKDIQVQPTETTESVF